MGVGGLSFAPTKSLPLQEGSLQCVRAPQTDPCAPLRQQNSPTQTCARHQSAALQVMWTCPDAHGKRIAVSQK